MTLKAEFRPLIEPAIPGVVNFLKSHEWAVCWAGTDALSKLSGQGETATLSSQPLIMKSQLNFDLQLVMRPIFWQVQLPYQNCLSMVRQSVVHA